MESSCIEFWVKQTNIRSTHMQVSFNKAQLASLWNIYINILNILFLWGRGHTSWHQFMFLIFSGSNSSQLKSTEALSLTFRSTVRISLSEYIDMIYLGVLITLVLWLHLHNVFVCISCNEYFWAIPPSITGKIRKKIFVIKWIGSQRHLETPQNSPMVSTREMSFSLLLTMEHSLGSLLRAI